MFVYINNDTAHGHARKWTYSLVGKFSRTYSKMKKTSRTIVTIAVTAIYLMIAMRSLAPLVLNSPAVAHAITGECSGDCAICGCAPERSASRTCCCWQKKLRHKHDPDQSEVADCCKKKRRVAGSKRGYSSSPCGSGKHFAIFGGETFEQLPCCFNSTTVTIRIETISSLSNHRPADRYGDPPDPPPKLG